jgi:aspartate beta-hydroxylase
MTKPVLFTAAMAQPAEERTAKTLAALARAVYALASDLRAMGPEGERVLATEGGAEARAAALLADVHGLRERLATARPAWLAAQQSRLGLAPDAKDLKLHIGCGEHALPGWVNLDVHPAPLCWNVHWGLPFADGSATHVFVSHLFEHLFFPHDAGAFLSELRRVMAPGARLRMIVPDVAQLIDAYQRGDREFFAKRAAHWAGANGDGPLLAQFLNYAGAGPDPGYLFEAHKFGYDFETLKAMLEIAGFSTITRSAYMQSDEPSLRLDDQSAVASAEHGAGHYSLFVEATVPGIAKSTPPPAMPAQAVPAERAARMQAAREAMASGRQREAIALLQAAHADEPQNAQVARSLGVALATAGDLDAAEEALKTATRIDPQLSAAHLHIGKIRESRKDFFGAVGAYFRAVTTAQSREQWLDEASTPAWLQDDVLHAMAMVHEHRVPVLMGLMHPLNERFGASEMQRVRAGLAQYLGIESHPPQDARQVPRFLHIPGLASPPWFEPEQFDWIPGLEAQWMDLREEAESVLRERAGLQPFLEAPDGASLDAYLGGGNTARWDAFFFYRNGERFAENALKAPRTAAALDALPLVRIREHAPEICFSVLAPGSHIKPHYGVTNARVVAHLPLIVPPDCALNVGGDARAWQEGKVWVFDDTFLHEAWNRSDRTRVIVLMDAWNPGLTDAERIAVTEIVEGIGEFNRG